MSIPEEKQSKGSIKKSAGSRPSKMKKPINPKDVSIDTATQNMLVRAQALGIETVFDRAEKMKPCNIGVQGTCCKNCGMGPCRLPLPKSGIEGPDERKGLCGATPNTIAARNFIRMIAGGAAAHSDHGRCVAEVFMTAARKETDAYRIKDTGKLMAVAPYLDVTTQVEVDGATVDHDIDEIALEVAEKALAEWGKADGELMYLKRAPQPLYEKWEKTGVLPPASVNTSDTTSRPPGTSEARAWPISSRQVSSVSRWKTPEISTTSLPSGKGVSL